MPPFRTNIFYIMKVFTAIRSALHNFHRRYPVIFETVKFLILSAVLAAAAAAGMRGLDYRWQWYRISDYIVSNTGDGLSAGLLLQGLKVTLLISAASLVLSFVIGFMTALCRLSESVTAVFFSRLYLELIRNTPLLIQLFLMYFVAAPILGMGRNLAAVLALSLFEGAYTSEIIRSGIISIEKGQWEASHSIGLSKALTYRLIILPQTFRQILPILAGQAISLIKDSSLVSTIAIYDLTMRGQVAISKTFLTFEIWFTVALIYLIINMSLSVIIRFMEKRMKRIEL